MPSGLERVEAAVPDLILLDIVMPVLDGFAFLDRLIDDRGAADIPIVLLSATHTLPEGAQTVGVKALLTRAVGYGRHCCCRLSTVSPAHRDPTTGLIGRTVPGPPRWHGPSWSDPRRARYSGARQLGVWPEQDPHRTRVAVDHQRVGRQTERLQNERGRLLGAGACFDT